MSTYYQSIFLPILSLFNLFVMASLHAQDLDSRQWKNRVLIIKSEDGKNDHFKQQLKEFETSEAGLKERKIALYRIVGNDFWLKDYTGQFVNTSGKITSKFKGEILEASKNFEVILIGLDGGVKLRQSSLLSKKTAFTAYRFHAHEGK